MFPIGGFDRFLCVFFILGSYGICCAQVVDPMTAAQAPVPGVGHHYIGMATETVNPSDGSISFHLPIQTPSGRGLSFPFGITYNGSAPFSLGNSNSPWFGWELPSSYGIPPLSVNGWSYDLPSYVAQASVASSQVSPSSTSVYNFVYDYCWETNNYQFTGFAGQFALNQANSFPDNGNPNFPADISICQENGGAGFGGGFSSGGDDGVASAMGPSPHNSGLSYNTQPSLTVSDRDGTVYQFPQGPVISASPTIVGVQTFGALAQTITDRNGNQIVLNGTSLVLGDSGALLPPGSYNDTAGRPIVSWTGIGRSTGDQITVSGLGAITVKWTTSAMSFPTGSTNLFSTSTACSAGGGPSGSITVSVVSEIDLPNGQTYSFTYGGTWGRLTKITFPDGGYVRYVWGTNSRSMGTYQTWIPYGMTQGHAFCVATLDTPAITDRYVSFDGTTEVLHQNFSKYTTNWVLTNVPSLSWSGKSTEVTTTDSRTNQTTIADYNYTSVLVSLGPNDKSWQVSNQVPVERTITYMDSTRKVLKTVNKTWMDRYAMVGDQTILDNGQGITKLRCLSGDHVIAAYEYNFQSAGSKPADPTCPSGLPSGGSTLSAGLTTTAIGPLLRQSATAYHTFVGTNILDEPDSVTTYDGSGNMLSRTTYQYDQSAVASSGASTGLVSPPGPRGNPTSVSRWLNTANSYLTTTYTYFDTGQVQTVKDPCGQPSASCPDISGSNHTTTYAYTDAYASGTGTPPGQTNAYVTKVTFPNTGVAHQESFTWGYNDGLLRSHTDQNTQTINYCYLTGGCSGTTNDRLLRLTQILGPADPNNGSQRPATTYSYSDWTTANKTPTSMTKTVLQNTGGTVLTSEQIFDGMGHVTDSETSDASGMDDVHTVYDGFGRAYTVTTPYRLTSDPTYGVATTLYDAIGRTSSYTDSDGTSTQKWSYSGASTTYTDEKNNQWTRTNDALGRLIQVLEPNGYAQTPSMETDYTYDLLDNLQSVKQWGGPVNSVGMHSRSFTYDSLSRLIQSFNPESGWTCYGTTGGTAANGSNCYSGYDANGNLQAKTDARAVTTQFTYDDLNRVLSKRYASDVSATPYSCNQYDASSLAGANANLVGRLTNQWTQRSSTGACASALPSSGVLTRRSILAYDPLGRAISEQQCTPVTCTGTPYKPTYSYDLAGEMTTMSNGITGTPTVGTLTFTYGYDSTGRLQTLKSNWSDSSHPGTLFSAQAPANSPCANGTTAAAYLAPYTPSGSLQNAALGSSLTLNRTYDTRLRPTCEIDKAGVVPAATPASATILITGAEQSK